MNTSNTMDETKRNNQLSLLHALSFGSLADTKTLLSFTAKDLLDKEYLEFQIGSKKVVRTFYFDKKVLQLIEICTNGKSSSDLVFDLCSVDDIDYEEIVASWTKYYYSETGNRYYPQFLFELTDSQICEILNL